MRLVWCSSIALFGFAAGCGAAAPAGSTSSRALNIADADWVSFAVPEGGYSLDLPSARPQRQVQLSETNQETFLYTAAHASEIAVVASAEPMGVIVRPANAGQVLDAVGALFVQRARAQGCEPSAIRTIEHQAHDGRVVEGHHCSNLAGGELMVAGFLHGSVLASVVLVIGAPADGATRDSIRHRVFDSVQFGPPPGWFHALDHPVEVAELPGLAFSMPSAPVRTATEIDLGLDIRYVSEAITGMAMIVSVLPIMRPPQPRLYWCNALVQSGSLTGVVREDRANVAVPYCRVRGLRTTDPTVIEIHDLSVFGDALFEAIWVGPYEPAFVAGGEAQLDALRASLRHP